MVSLRGEVKHWLPDFDSRRAHATGDQRVSEIPSAVAKVQTAHGGDIVD